MTTDARPTPWIDRALARTARSAHARPWAVIVGALAVIAASWFAASRLEVHGDFLDLLPERSEGARLFRQAMARMGGGSATLFVVVRSPDPEANKRIVDAIEPGLRALPRSLVRTVEHGPEEARRFYLQRKWLFADVGDLEEVECELSRARRRAQPGFVDLDDEPCSAQRSDRAERPSASPAPAASAPQVSESARPFERFRAQLASRSRELDRYPTGYFRTADGGIYLLVIRASGAGFGDRAGDELIARVNAVIARANPRSINPRAEVGLGGDIPNAAAERDSLIKEAALSTGLAFILILGSLVLFFRTPWALGHIGLALFTGVGLAYAVAYVAFGYLTISTAFLGSIVAGNGINYSIMYLARYRERRAAGDGVERALVDASVTCRAGTQLSSLAAAGAYGSLMLTGFRGFSQFGLIGASGMLFCWCATMVIVPASITVVERQRARLSKSDAPAAEAPPSAPVMRAVAALTGRYAPVVLLLGITAVGLSVSKLPAYLRDPWEYNFAKLQSSGSRQTGADAWSSEADKVFRADAAPPPPPPAAGASNAPRDEGSGAVDMILADSIDDAIPIGEALKARDRARTGGRYIHHVETAWDVLGGPPPVVARKLELLARVREHIDAMLPHLDARDRATAEEWRPPETLREIRPDELPSLVRERFTEKNGRFGTPVFVHYRAHYSPSDGRALLVVSSLTQNVRLADGRVVPTASRATVFAEMIRSMETDGPRATLGSLAAVVLVVVLAARGLRARLAVLASLFAGVALTVGGAAWLDTRLNFLNFVALPLTFGIGVEYAVNLYDRLRYTRGDVAAALRSVGGAVALCSFTTIIGYGALLVADNQAMRSFGRYAMAGELACLATAIALLPATLRLVGGARDEEAPR